MIFILFAVCASASIYSEYLRGFLSGFQGTEVFLGENCLSAKWVDKLKTDYITLAQLVSEKKYASALNTARELAFDLISETNDCHIEELVKIISSLSELKTTTKIFRLIENMPDIFDELEEADINNPYVMGFHIGKALSYMETDKSLNIPTIDPIAFSDLVQGIIRPLVVMTPNCTEAFNHCLSFTLKKSINLLNSYLDGDQSVLPDLLKTIDQLNKINHHMQNLCEATELPGKLSKAFLTKEGLVQSYLKVGMHLVEYIVLEKRAAIHLLARNYAKLGEDIGNMIKILII